MSGNAQAGGQGRPREPQKSSSMAPGLEFEEVWRDLQPRIVAMLVRRGTPKDVAEDVAQETAIRLLTNWHLLDEGRSPWPFARRIALNCLVDRYRRERFDTVESYPDREGTHDVEEHSLARFRLTEVWRAMADLTQKERSLLLAEVGIAAGHANDSATKMARHRARRKLTAAVGRSGAFSGLPLAWRRATAWVQLHAPAYVEVGTAAGLAVIMSAAALTWGQPGHAATKPPSLTFGSEHTSVRRLEPVRDPESSEIPRPRPSGHGQQPAADPGPQKPAPSPSHDHATDPSYTAGAGPARAEAGRDEGTMYVTVCTGENTPMTEDDFEVTVRVQDGNQKPNDETPECNHGGGEENP